MISLLDLLYISLAVGFLVLVGFVVYLIINLKNTLDRVNMVLEDTRDVTKDVRGIKNMVKVSILGALSKVLRLIK